MHQLTSRRLLAVAIAEFFFFWGGPPLKLSVRGNPYDGTVVLVSNDSRIAATTPVFQRRGVIVYKVGLF